MLTTLLFPHVELYFNEGTVKQQQRVAKTTIS